MKKQTQVRRNSSTAAAPSQPKTPEGKGRRHRLPSGAGPFAPNVDYPACLCTFDRIAGSPVSKIPISDDEFTSLLTNSIREGGGIERFIADAIREKVARKPAALTSNPAQPVPELGLEDAHDRLEVIVPQVVVMLSLLSDAYWKACDTDDEYQSARANGLISLAASASRQLERESDQAMHEWLKTLIRPT